MRAIRKLADHVVDTSEMTVHELRHAFTGVAAGASPGSQLVVTILSFGFKHGIPVDSDLLFDVRFLPNPHFVPTLRPHTGRDREVVKYLDSSPATHEFLDHTLNLLKFLIPQYVAEGKTYLTIGIGCTGGRHRSVTIAEALKKGLAGIPGVRLGCGIGILRMSNRPFLVLGSWFFDRSPLVRSSFSVFRFTVLRSSNETWSRRGHARAARGRAGQFRGDDRRRPAAVCGGVDRLARRRRAGARGHRAGDRARERDRPAAPRPSRRTCWSSPTCSAARRPIWASRS